MCLVGGICDWSFGNGTNGSVTGPTGTCCKGAAVGSSGGRVTGGAAGSVGV